MNPLALMLLQSFILKFESWFYAVISESVNQKFFMWINFDLLCPYASIDAEVERIGDLALMLAKGFYVEIHILGVYLWT